MNTKPKPSCTFILLVILLAACTAIASPSPDSTTSLTIECMVAYRASVTEGIEREESIVLSAAAPTQRLPFTDLTFHAQYLPGDAPPKEHGLRLWVTTGESDSELIAQLFQLPLTEAAHNQFRGDHGFTGLSYVYHPESGAELQYTCKAK